METHAENLKDLWLRAVAQTWRGFLTSRRKLRSLKRELISSQQHMEDRVNKLEALISDRLQKAAGDCDSFRARVEHLESQLKSAMGDRTHIHHELTKLNDEVKSQSDRMRKLEKRFVGKLTSCEQT